MKNNNFLWSRRIHSKEFYLIKTIIYWLSFYNRKWVYKKISLELVIVWHLNTKWQIKNSCLERLKDRMSLLVLLVQKDTFNLGLRAGKCILSLSVPSPRLTTSGENNSQSERAALIISTKFFQKPIHLYDRLFLYERNLRSKRSQKITKR